jgi:hypothetical protein
MHQSRKANSVLNIYCAEVGCGRPKKMQHNKHPFRVKDNQSNLKDSAKEEEPHKITRDGERKLQLSMCS